MPQTSRAIAITATTGRMAERVAVWVEIIATTLSLCHRNPSRNVMAVPMGEITRALVGVRRRLCVKWGFVDMDAYEQEYRFCYFTRCPYEKTDTTFRSIPLTTESFPQKEGGEAV